MSCNSRPQRTPYPKMAATFKARYFFFYNFINALIPRSPVLESAIDALKIANVMGLIGLVLLGEDGRLFAGYGFLLTAFSSTHSSCPYQFPI